MEMLTQKQKVMAMAVIAIVAIIIVYYYINSTKEVYNYNEISNVVENSQEEDTSETEQKEIVVHVTGAVKNEGIVKVKENSRINDVIEAAGGVTSNADLSNVNLAYVIEDGQKIYIPCKTEEQGLQEEEEQNIVSEGAGGNVLEIDDETINVTFVNINTASAEKLEQLPGIGSSTAAKIIEYREKYGKFKTIEDIKNVSGIGNSKYEAIKDFIYV